MIKDTKVKRYLKFAVAGDTMLGRLVDQLFSIHSNDPENTRYIESWKRKHPEAVQKFTSNPYTYVWGDLLPVFRSWADVRLINLETSITTNEEKDPKEFNYRMHPHNVRSLTEAKIDYCSLANNHILDYKEKGLLETVAVLKENSIKFAGVGTEEEAWEPTTITKSIQQDKESKNIDIMCFSFSDHYKKWAAKGNKIGINFLDVDVMDENDFKVVQKKIEEKKKNRRPDIVVASIHWGSNYSWQPPKNFRRFAHFLVDECGIDLIHGHSSHHIQGIEVYKKKPILYGCGDFIDDYAVDDDYRNDLGFLYKLMYDVDKKEWKKIVLVPTKIKQFSVSSMVTKGERTWLTEKIKTLSAVFGTTVKEKANHTLQISIT